MFRLCDYARWFNIPLNLRLGSLVLLDCSRLLIDRSQHREIYLGPFYAGPDIVFDSML